MIDSALNESRGDSTIGIDDNGNFVVAWSDVQLDGSRGDVDISARRYTANGTPDSGILRVNNIDSGYDTGPTIASDADGDIVIAWSNGSGIAARQYSPRSSNSGNPPGNPPGNPGNPGNNPGNGGSNRQIGTARADRLRGTSGRDVMKALGGDDRLIGRGGNDTLVGGGGDDIINGGRGNDTLRGNRGSDRLLGRAGNDKLNGGSGNDILDGGSGVDVIKGGGGRDTFVLRRGKGLNRIKDFSRQDQLAVKGRINVDDITFTAKGNGTLISIGNDELAILQGVRPGQLPANLL
ncbi:MAG: calcium-binding protein [Elainellaceae cyanobacterium]